MVHLIFLILSIDLVHLCNKSINDKLVQCMADSLYKINRITKVSIYPIQKFIFAVKNGEVKKVQVTE